LFWVQRQIFMYIVHLHNLSTCKYSLSNNLLNFVFHLSQLFLISFMLFFIAKKNIQCNFKPVFRRYITINRIKIHNIKQTLSLLEKVLWKISYYFFCRVYQIMHKQHWAYEMGKDNKTHWALWRFEFINNYRAHLIGYKFDILCDIEKPRKLWILKWVQNLRRHNHATFQPANLQPANMKPPNMKHANLPTRNQPTCTPSFMIPFTLIFLIFV